ncbi:MAG: alpha/beta hydrolase [Chroococcidiopsidaceae cyanobacterium CP_BM_ER_R8_30]|nr:alpha/beta hydrolase [Chroococcidiopsidaceae cyanobacterium CP_BM_ER_R8_30]
MNSINVDFRIQLLDWLVSGGKSIHQMMPEKLRQLTQVKIHPLKAYLKTKIEPLKVRFISGRAIALPKVVTQTIGGRHGDIPLQLYYPATQTNLALLIFIHGGGWVSGNFETHDVMCRRIAHISGALVVAVGYRLAPKHKYPTALEDCYDALTWVVQNAQKLGADASSLIVMGDSAGGNLTAAMSLMARDLSGPKISRQILLYPILDGSMSQPSIERYAHAPVLTSDMIQYSIQHYARTESDKYEPYFSPLFAHNLSNLAPALVITAQYDPLHDEGQAYAQRLREAGIAVQVTDYAGMVHGFLSFPMFCRGADPAFTEITAYIRQAIDSAVL